MSPMLFAVLICLLTTTTSIASDCRFESSPNVLEKSESHLLQYWDFSDASVALSQVLPRSKAFDTYRDEIKSRIGINPNDLLKRYLSVSPDTNDAFNIEVVQKSVVADIRPIRCIEALLLDYQISRNPKMLTDPTEFISFYLRRSNGRLRVYYLTDDINGVRMIRGLIAHAQSDLKKDWVLDGNLHNHSFFINAIDPGDKFHPQGVLAPSASDISVFLRQREELRLQSASITNGFHTIDIRSEDFVFFRAAKN